MFRRKAYVVTGSEDGIIGIASSKQLAFQAACQYVQNPTTLCYCIGNEHYKVKVSYQTARHQWIYWIEGKNKDNHFLEVEVKEWKTNYFGGLLPSDSE